MKKSNLRGQGLRKVFILAVTLLALTTFLPQPSQGYQTDSTGPQFLGFQSSQLQGGPIAYFIDSSGQFTINQIRQVPFRISYSSFLSRFSQASGPSGYWVKFKIYNKTDSSLKVFLNCGKNINYIDLYLIPDSGSARVIQGGILHRLTAKQSTLEQFTQTVPFTLLPFQKGEIFLKLVQKTETFNFGGIQLYSEHELMQRLGERSFSHQRFIIFPLLFQGFLLCQLIYVLSQWLITHRKEYAYYFYYLLVIATYFLSMYEYSFQSRFLFARFPTLSIYLNKILLMLPYFFYFRFIRSFLEIPKFYPRMNKWIVRIEYFLLVYMVINFIFLLIFFNLKLERELFTYVLIMVFITSAGFLIYLLGEKKTLTYFIASGSFFVGLGNIIGLILDYLEGEKITHHFSDTLIFSQIGVILEISCFTAGLSFKSLKSEKEKIKSQATLIEQLKANEVLQTKMQNIRNTIARDLHDEIGSTLSSISILSNLALQEKNDQQAMATMLEIKDSSVTLMEKMDDIVWSINPKNDSLDNLLLRVRRFATTLFEAKNIDYCINIEENINQVKLPMEWRQHVYLILKEAINNLVKYSGATRAEMEVSYEQNSLDLLIRDNGSGFDSSLPYTGNGLLSMQNRAKAMQAGLRITSCPGEGTSILLTLKIK